MPTVFMMRSEGLEEGEQMKEMDGVRQTSEEKADELRQWGNGMTTLYYDFSEVKGVGFFHRLGGGRGGKDLLPEEEHSSSGG